MSVNSRYEYVLPSMKLEKVRSKLIRLEMSAEIRTLLESLPIVDFVETQLGNHIYMGKGKVKIGSQTVNSYIRIWTQDNDIMVYLKAGNLSATHLFNSKEEQKRSVVLFKNLLKFGWN